MTIMCFTVHVLFSVAKLVITTWVCHKLGGATLVMIQGFGSKLVAG